MVGMFNTFQTDMTSDSINRSFVEVIIKRDDFTIATHTTNG